MKPTHSNTMCKPSVERPVGGLGLVIAALVVAAATLLGPRTVRAESGAFASNGDIPHERNRRGSVGKEIAGGLVGYFAGGFAGMIVGIVPAKLIPPEDNNFAIVSLGGNIGANLGIGWGVAAAGRASGGNGKAGFAMLGSVTGMTLSGLVVGGAGALAEGAGATGVRNVAIAVGVPVIWTSMIGGGVLGYRWSGARECCVSEDVAVHPYVSPATGGDGGRAGVSVRW